jgi:hypothetical protein
VSVPVARFGIELFVAGSAQWIFGCVSFGGPSGLVSATNLLRARTAVGVETEPRASLRRSYRNEIRDDADYRVNGSSRLCWYDPVRRWIRQWRRGFDSGLVSITALAAVLNPQAAITVMSSLIIAAKINLMDKLDEEILRLIRSEIREL